MWHSLLACLFRRILNRFNGFELLDFQILALNLEVKRLLVECPRSWSADRGSDNSKFACTMVDTGPTLLTIAVLSGPIRLMPSEIK